MSLFEDVPSTPLARPLRVVILGCSGSIGTQALDVCRMHADKIQVVGLSVYSSCEKLVCAQREFNVPNVVVANVSHKDDPALAELPESCHVGFGPDAVRRLATLPEVDCVLVAVVGEAGIGACYDALAADKIVACANKEALVSGGDLLMPIVKPGKLIPVDSEHSAIFQCLRGERASELSRIWLTCSGGPFLGKTAQELAQVTPEQALAHPSWSMGPKITIDSATLMNKGLEVLEAHHLFGVSVDAIDVLIQPQSRIHSMVEFVDGSVIAQLGPSDMRIPIQLAFSYPDRWESPASSVDFRQEMPLQFSQPDMKTFRCLALAYEAGRTGGTLPCAMNAANEIANAAFRNKRLPFMEIPQVVERVMDLTQVERVESLEQLEEVDRLARTRAETVIGGTEV